MCEYISSISRKLVTILACIKCVCLTTPNKKGGVTTIVLGGYGASFIQFCCFWFIEVDVNGQ